MSYFLVSRRKNHLSHLLTDEDSDHKSQQFLAGRCFKSATYLPENIFTNFKTYSGLLYNYPSYDQERLNKHAITQS